jgi:hypothetical protein
MEPSSTLMCSHSLQSSLFLFSWWGGREFRFEINLHPPSKEVSSFAFSIKTLYAFWKPMSAWSEAWTVFSRSNPGVVGSNPFEARMSVYAYSVFVLSRVLVAALRRADPPVQEFLPCINSVAWVRERPPLVGKISANFCGWKVSSIQFDGSLLPYSWLSSRYWLCIGSRK